MHINVDMTRIRDLIALACLCAVCGGGPVFEATVSADEGTLNVVEPPDNGMALVNPDMGWTMHFYSNVISNYGSKLEPSDTLDDFPGLSTVYLRLPWSFLEPVEGQFDWSVIDTPAQRWISKGKRVALRISCCESWMRYATPEWVQQAARRATTSPSARGSTRTVHTGNRSTTTRSSWTSWSDS